MAHTFGTGNPFRTKVRCALFNYHIRKEAQNARRKYEQQQHRKPEVLDKALMLTDPCDAYPADNQPDASWLRNDINGRPISHRMRRIKQRTIPKERQKLDRRRSQACVLEEVNATSSRLLQLPLELVQCMRSFLDIDDNICLAATCRGMRDMPMCPIVTPKRCLRRALYKERWWAIADQEETYYPDRRVLLCWGYMKPHKYTEFSCDERVKSARTRECLWVWEERNCYRRTGCLWYSKEPTIHWG
jgi:hypothetical protein